MKTLKKSLALVLTLVLCLGLCAVPALATDENLITDVNSTEAQAWKTWYDGDKSIGNGGNTYSNIRKTSNMREDYGNLSDGSFFIAKFDPSQWEDKSLVTSDKVKLQFSTTSEEKITLNVGQYATGMSPGQFNDTWFPILQTTSRFNPATVEIGGDAESVTYQLLYQPGFYNSQTNTTGSLAVGVALVGGAESATVTVTLLDQENTEMNSFSHDLTYSSQSTQTEVTGINVTWVGPFLNSYENDYNGPGVGISLYLTVTGGTGNETATWSSTDENVATVEDADSARERGIDVHSGAAAYVSFVGAGTATIKASIGNVEGTYEVKLSAPTVEFKVDENTLSRTTYSYGTPANEIVVPVDPVKDGYTFKGWAPALGPVTSSVTYTAQWTPKVTAGGTTYDTLNEAIAQVQDHTVLEVAGSVDLGDTADNTITVPADSTVTVENSTIADNSGSTAIAKELTITKADRSTETAYLVTVGDTTAAVKSSAIGNEVVAEDYSGNTLSGNAAAAQLFDIPTVLATISNTANTAIADVDFSMKATDEGVAQKPEHTKTFEVHPVATAGGTEYEVPAAALKAQKYSVTLDFGTANAGKYAKLTHYKSVGGTEDLGTYPVGVDGKVTFTMDSFSEVGVTLQESSYRVSITDTETAYNAASTTETAAAGETITMYVKLNDANNDLANPTPFIYGAGTITYNPALVELTGVELNSGFTALQYTSGGFDLKDDGNGTITFEAKQKDGTAGAAITSGNTLYTLTFTVRDSVRNNTTNPTQTAAFAITSANAATVTDTVGNKKASDTVNDNVTILMSFDATVTPEDGTPVTDTAVYNRDYTYEIAGYDAATYTYIVDVTVNGSPYAAAPDADGKITIPGADVTGVVTISVSKISVAVQGDYVDGWYLVRVTDAGGSSRKFQFDAGTDNMFKVTSGTGTYYAILVSEADYGENKTNADFAPLVKVADNVRSELTIPTLDVNGTGSNDYNDYLRVFVCYEEKADVVTYMADYIRADYNGDNGVDSTDFTAVYNAINSIGG